MNQPTKLGYVIAYVADVKITMAFYERAFGLKQRFLHESGQYGEMETGGTALAFAQQESSPTAGAFRPIRKDEPAPPMEIAFVVLDVAAAYKTATQAGATSVSEPAQKPWGQIVSYVRDCNGFLVEICSEISK